MSAPAEADGPAGREAPEEADAPGYGPMPALSALLWGCVAAGGGAFLAALPAWAGAGRAAQTGVAVLLASPYLATLAAAAHYARRRRWPEAALALLLLVLLLAGLWLGTGRA